jgi:tetratricopeptide (TPR) repeat protein
VPEADIRVLVLPRSESRRRQRFLEYIVDETLAGRGVALAEKANSLNADVSIGWYHSTVYTADYLNGDYAHALEVARQNPQQEMFYSHLEIIPIYGQLGRKQEALEAWQSLLKVYPGATAASFEDWWRLWNISDAKVARLMDGVYKSGVIGVDARPGQ